MANNNQAIIELLVKDSASGQIVKVSASLGDLKKAASDAGANMGTAGSRVNDSIKGQSEALGMNRREWMRTGSEAAFYLTSIAGRSSEAGKGLAQVTGIATQLGESFMFGGGVGVGIAAVGIAISALVAKSPQIEELDKALASLGAPKATTGLSELLGVTEKQAEQMVEAAKGSDSYRQSLVELVHQTEAAHDPTVKYADAFGALFNWWKTGITWGAVLGDQISGLTGLLTGLLGVNKSLLQGGGGGSSGIGVDPAALAREADALKEHARIFDLMKSSVPAARKEIDSYNETLNKLSRDHKKAVESFSQDLLASEQKASEDRLALQQDTARSIDRIYSGLSERLGDMAEDANEQHAESEHDWLKQAAGFASDRAGIERDLAAKLADIQKNLADEIDSIRTSANDKVEQISHDSARDEQGKTWAQVIAIRQKAKEEQDATLKEAKSKTDALNKDVSEKQTAAQAEAAKRRAELAQREREALDEHNYREGLAEQQSIKAAQRARREADQQAEETRRTEGERMAAIDQRAAKEQVEIGKRAAAETAAYTQSKTDATTAHNSRMKELLDTRTETQRLASDWLIVKGNVDSTTQSLIYQSGVVGSMSVPNMNLNTSSDWASRGYAEGGAFTVPGSGSGDRPYIIPLTPGERVTVTPVGGANKRGSRTVQFNNCNFRSVDDVYAALDRADRGLL